MTFWWPASTPAPSSSVPLKHWVFHTCSKVCTVFWLNLLSNQTLIISYSAPQTKTHHFLVVQRLRAQKCCFVLFGVPCQEWFWQRRLTVFLSRKLRSLVVVALRFCYFTFSTAFLNTYSFLLDKKQWLKTLADGQWWKRLGRKSSKRLVNPRFLQITCFFCVFQRASLYLLWKARTKLIV